MLRVRLQSVTLLLSQKWSYLQQAMHFANIYLLCLVQGGQD